MTGPQNVFWSTLKDLWKIFKEVCTWPSLGAPLRNSSSPFLWDCFPSTLLKRRETEKINFETDFRAGYQNLCFFFRLAPRQPPCQTDPMNAHQKSTSQPLRQTQEHYNGPCACFATAWCRQPGRPSMRPFWATGSWLRQQEAQASHCLCA